MKLPVAASVCFAAMLLAGPPAKADDLGQEIDAARAAYAKGDDLRLLKALQVSAITTGQRLSGQLARVMPPAPSGWDGGSPEFQALDGIGGGLSMTRGYSREPATLNASLVIDNPAVAGTSASLDGAGGLASQPGWGRVRINGEDAFLRFDTKTRCGEILILVGTRALLQIEGTEIGTSDILTETARGWDIAAIRKLLTN